MISARHIRRGTMRVYWATAIADTAAPTVAEITAGDDITQNVQQILGFAVTRLPLSLPVAGPYGGVLSIAGPKLVEEPPTLVCYDEGSATSSLRTTIAEGTRGYVIFCLDGQPSVNDRAVVWPVITASLRDRIVADVEAATFSATFSVWDEPEEGATVS